MVTVTGGSRDPPVTSCLPGTFSSISCRATLERAGEGAAGTITKAAKLSLVDLAGSEKWNIGTGKEGLENKAQQVAELTNINGSLSA